MSEKEMYDQLNEWMDKIGLKCPALEILPVGALERWYAEYEKIDDILEGLNDEHWSYLV